MMNTLVKRNKVKVMRLLPGINRASMLTSTPTFNKGLTAQVSQKITFTDFDLSHKIINVRVETRIAFVTIPEDMSITLLRRYIRNNCKDGCIYRILSNHPILNPGQEYTIKEGFKSLNLFASNQLVKYPDGRIVLDMQGKHQYRVTKYSTILKEDEDLRTIDNESYYPAPEELISN